MQEFLHEIWLFIRVTINPSFWISIQSVNPAWDATVRELINRGGEVEYLTRCSVTVGGVPIWVANYPYGYGDHYIREDGLPTRRTRLLLQEHISRDLCSGDLQLSVNSKGDNQ